MWEQVTPQQATALQPGLPSGGAVRLADWQSKFQSLSASVNPKTELGQLCFRFPAWPVALHAIKGDGGMHLLAGSLPLVLGLLCYGHQQAVIRPQKGPHYLHL